MWNPNPKTARADEPQAPQPGGMAARITAAAQPNTAYIGKTICIKGEIAGAETLHIDGRVEGALRLDGGYLNVGPGAQVRANVWAREAVVRGEVTGNLTAGERLDIRNGGSLVGDVVAASVSIEEGAYFKGSIDMRRVEKAKPAFSQSDAKEELAAVAATA